MKPKHFTTILFTGILLITHAEIQAASVRKAPNLIVIMCDDLGYADVGFNGSTDIPTPHIDRIAKEGVTCTSGYVSYPVCGPSRAGFITGRYGARFGFERNPQYTTTDPTMGVPTSERTIAEHLRAVGYTSGIIGKWHLGAENSLHPNNRGFDFFYGHLGGGHRYMPEDLVIKDSVSAKNENESYRTWISRNHEHEPIDQYLTDEFSDEAVEFVTRNQDKPFFLFLSYNAPHLPLQATQKYLDRFDHIEDTKRKTYAAMVSAVDDGVGRLLDQLDALDLEQETLIFFLSDNGGPTSKNSSQNTPLRGSKGDVWEGGFRVPYAVRWTGTLPSGTTFDQPVSSLDILGTISELSGSPKDSKRALDGVNLIPYLTGTAKTKLSKPVFIRKFDNGKWVVRKDDHKLIAQKDGKNPLVFNVTEDIGETNNLAKSNPEVLASLESLRQEWDAQLIDPIFLGLIHTPEWQAKVKRLKRAKANKEWDWFSNLDGNKNGNITEEEWMNWYKQSQDTETDLPTQKIYFEERDLDQNGSITRKEFDSHAK